MLDQTKAQAGHRFAGMRARLRVILQRLRRQYLLDPREREFLSMSPRAQVAGDSRAAPVLVVQCVEDHRYLCLFSSIANELRSRQSVSVHQIVSRSLRPGASRSPIALLGALLLFNSFTDRKWRRLFAAFCDKVAYRGTGVDWPTHELADLLSALRLWCGLKSKQNVLDLKIDALPVGDLVYDTYLRFKPAATVEPSSWYLFQVVWQALRIARRALRYFEKVRPAVFLTSYSTYIQHGIAARVALSCNVRVFSFGNYQEFCKELTAQDWVHTRNPDHYRTDFARLSDPEARLEKAQAGMAARFAGQIDSATAYMRQSAYAFGNQSIPDVSGGTVVFLHDFFDSPHCYRWMIFPDFWEWAVHTIEAARRHGVRLFVKPHPNQIAESTSVVERLRALYPEVIFLPHTVSNQQLSQGGIRCAATVYGTVAHEMAYLGVPSIAAGDHPHVNFDFCRTARDAGEYEAMLSDMSGRDFSKEEMRRQSLEFYYMHNLHMSNDLLALREWMGQLRAEIIKAGDALPCMGTWRELDRRLRAEPAFGHFADRLSELMSGRQ